MTLHWGKRIAIVYIVFVGCTLAFVAMAMRTDVDLVRDDYYQHSLLHDNTMKAQQRAAQILPAIAFQYDPSQQRIAVELPTRFEGTPVRIELYRASSNSDDRRMTAVVDSMGSIVISTTDLHAVRWRITLLWEFETEQYELERYITVVPS